MCFPFPALFSLVSGEELLWLEADRLLLLAELFLLSFFLDGGLANPQSFSLSLSSFFPELLLDLEPDPLRDREPEPLL